jgi:hypothetical protein
LGAAPGGRCRTVDCSYLVEPPEPEDAEAAWGRGGSGRSPLLAMDAAYLEEPEPVEPEPRLSVGEVEPSRGVVLPLFSHVRGGPETDARPIVPGLPE